MPFGRNLFPPILNQAQTNFSLGGTESHPETQSHVTLIYNMYLHACAAYVSLCFSALWWERDKDWEMAEGHLTGNLSSEPWTVGSHRLTHDVGATDCGRTQTETCDVRAMEWEDTDTVILEPCYLAGPFSGRRRSLSSLLPDSPGQW